MNNAVIYLTFDDGPDPDTTPRLLDILAAYGVRACFFILGRQAVRFP
ncbi:MAG TPA: polysaccharide deacetylase family protein, partial [Gammaproteobacteria bacterium]